MCGARELAASSATANEDPPLPSLFLPSHSHSHSPLSSLVDARNGNELLRNDPRWGRSAAAAEDTYGLGSKITRLHRMSMLKKLSFVVRVEVAAVGQLI